MAKPFHVPKGTFHSVSLQNKLTAKLQFILPIIYIFKNTIAPSPNINPAICIKESLSLYIKVETMTVQTIPPTEIKGKNTEAFIFITKIITKRFTNALRPPLQSAYIPPFLYPFFRIKERQFPQRVQTLKVRQS